MGKDKFDMDWIEEAERKLGRCCRSVNTYIIYMCTYFVFHGDSLWNQFFCFSASKWNNNVNRGKSETLIPFQCERKGP